MRKATIPQPVIDVVASVLAEVFTHETMNNAFIAAGAPGESPEGSKPAKAQGWLIRCNADDAVDPLKVLGCLLSTLFDTPASHWGGERNWNYISRIQGVEEVLARCGLRYQSVGRVLGSTPASPSRSLEALLTERDLEAVEGEFERALASVDSSPAEAVSAACNILESLCKTYLEDEGVSLPSKQDVASLWKATSKCLGLDPAVMPTQDLKQILSGLYSVTQGVGALRTHVSTAHGQGRTRYRIEPRHARLAIHAAHTIATFVIETWDARLTSR